MVWQKQKKTAIAYTGIECLQKAHSSLSVFYEFVILSIKDFSKWREESQPEKRGIEREK